MINVLRAALRIAAKRDIRFYLVGVHMKRTDQGIVVEATDGHKAMQCIVADHDIMAGFPEGADVIFTRGSIDMIIKMGTCDIQFDDGVYYSNGLKLMTLADGHFPDINRLLTLVKGLPEVKKGVDVVQMKDCCAAIADMKKGCSFSTAIMTQCGANDAFMWEGTTARDWEFRVLLMPCRIKP